MARQDAGHCAGLIHAARRLGVLVGIGLMAFFALSTPALATPGDLDSSFGSGGIVASSLGNENIGNPADVGIQADGKIVVVSRVETCSPSCQREFLVERYTESGALDTSFGNGDGIVTTSFGEASQASSVVVEPSGKILVSGTTENEIEPNRYESEFALARYNSDGSLDTSFGDGTGKTTAAVPDISGLRSWSGSMALQPDGKIVLGGTGFILQSEWGWEEYMALARFTASGTLDTSYGTGGTLVGPAGSIYGLTTDANGRALAVGQSGRDFTLARFTTGGNLDTSFAGGGLIKLHLIDPVFGSNASGVLVQPDGKILASGYGYGMTVARFNEDGTPDTSFGGGDGIVTPSFSLPCCVTSAAIAMALQPDGRIVFAGQWRPDYESFKDEWAIGRLYANGATDKSFGSGGLVTNAFEGGGYGDYATGVALQANGKIVAVGVSGTALYPNEDLGVMRFLGGGTSAQPSSHRLAIENSDPAKGLVSAPDLTCGYNCAADYEAGETVEVRAEGNYVEEGSEWTQLPFTGWTAISGDPGTCTGTTTPCEVALTGDVELKATFGGGSPPERQLTISKSGSGSGMVTSSPAGIACGATCSSKFADGTEVTLTAAPAAGSTFTGWSGGGCSGTGPCKLSLEADVKVIATFTTESSGGSGEGGGSPNPSPAPTPQPQPVKHKKPLKCHKGFKKRKVHGKARCVRVKKQAHHKAARMAQVRGRTMDRRAASRANLSWSLPHAVNEGAPIPFSWTGRHLGRHHRLVVQRPVGTAHTWRSIMRLPSNSGSAELPGLPLGRYRYRIADLSGHRVLAQQVTGIAVFGQVPLKTLFKSNEQAYVTPTNSFSYVGSFEEEAVAYEGGGPAFTVEQNHCLSVHIGFVAGADKPGSGTLILVQESRDPVSASAPFDGIGSLDASLVPGQSWAVNIVYKMTNYEEYILRLTTYINGYAICDSTESFFSS